MGPGFASRFSPRVGVSASVLEKGGEFECYLEGKRTASELLPVSLFHSPASFAGRARFRLWAAFCQAPHLRSAFGCSF